MCPCHEDEGRDKLWHILTVDYNTVDYSQGQWAPIAATPA